ncbi:hypothetical protein D9M70_461260 [compost metagenome]
MVFDLGAAKLTGDFAQVGLHNLFKVRASRGFFAQDDFANHRFDIGIRQLHRNLETAEQTLQVGHA